MTKEEYLSILEELKEVDSIKRRFTLRQILHNRLNPILQYLMKQRYCSSTAIWTVEWGPGYFEENVQVSIDYHIPRLSREAVDITISIEDFLDDRYVERLMEEKRLETMQKFDPQI